MKDPIIWQILFQLFLIVLNAVFASAEIAVISMNDNKVAKLAAQGDKRAVKLAILTSQPARFLATIQVAITLSGFLGSAFAADNFSDKLVNWLVSLGVQAPMQTLDMIAVVFITLVLSYFTLVFGELVPKRVAMKKAETLALGMSSLISFIAKIFAPVVWLLTASTNICLRLLKIDPNATDNEVSEEDIRMMVNTGSQNGIIPNEEKEMIQNVFAFDDLTVEEFATHRTEIDILWMDDSIQTWEETIHNTRHSHYPVCNESVDDVVGILNAKDYFRIQEKTRENIIQIAVRQPYFIPKSICADVLFRKMKQTRYHFAVVLDEYGGMIGIVTMNDLLEQLVGNIDDDPITEFTPPDIEQTDEHTWQIQGCASLEEVAEQLKVSLPTEEFNTFGGYVFNAYGSIPDDGSSFELMASCLHIHVVSIQEHKIKKAIVSVNPL